MDTHSDFIGLPRSFNVTQSAALASAAIIFTVNLSRSRTSSCRVRPFSFSAFSAFVFSHHLLFTLYHIWSRARAFLLQVRHKMKTWKSCRGIAFGVTSGRRWDCAKQRKISWLEKVSGTDEGKMTHWEDSCKSVTKERNERGPFYEKIMMREWGECKG